MEYVEVVNQWGPPSTLGVYELAPDQLSQQWRLLSGIASEAIAGFEVRVCGFVAGGQVVAEAVTYGSPEGMMIRVTLTQPGMRHDVWEKLVPADMTIGAMVKRFWEDPAGTAVVPALGASGSIARSGVGP
jgi:hypothetical protein